MNTIEKIKQIHEQIDLCSEFEQKFIQDNFERIEKFGDLTKFSAKQIQLVDRIYKERIEDGKAAAAKVAVGEA